MQIVITFGNNDQPYCIGAKYAKSGKNKEDYFELEKFRVTIIDLFIGR